MHPMASYGGNQYHRRRTARPRTLCSRNNCSPGKLVCHRAVQSHRQSDTCLRRFLVLVIQCLCLISCRLMSFQQTPKHRIRTSKHRIRERLRWSQDPRIRCSQDTRIRTRSQDTRGTRTRARWRQDQRIRCSQERPEAASVSEDMGLIAHLVDLKRFGGVRTSDFFESLYFHAGRKRRNGCKSGLCPA